ncbi:hypothetical protein BGZ51_003031 [Haplosporangium sp. Z 767]|nr:hypothetical protein BGZ51_003031 [Haplosporangium sp. Z 767]
MLDYLGDYSHTQSSAQQAKAFWSNLIPPHTPSASTPSPISTPASSRPSTTPETDTASETTASSIITTGARKKQTPAKRVRIPIACVNCRHKKIKCDGQNPCSHCTKFKAECIYPAATKPVNQQYVETLENRLKSVESHLNGLLNKGAGDDNQEGEHDTGRKNQQDGPLATSSSASEQENGNAESKSVVSGLISQSASGQAGSAPNLTSIPPIQRHYTSPAGLHIPARYTDNANAASNPLQPISANGAKALTNDTFISDGSTEILSFLMASLQVTNDGSAKFLSSLQEHQEQSFTDVRTYHSSNTLPPSGLTTITELPVLDWEPVMLPRPFTLPTSLLSPKTIGTLITVYFKSVHTFLPLLHKPSFMTLCDDGEYRVPPFLLMAMCAVASRHVTETDLQELIPTTKVGEALWAQDQHILFDHARVLLDTYNDIPRLSTVQGLLLLVYYQIREKCAGQFHRARTYLGLAVRMAQDMGLVRDLHKNIDELEATHTGESVLTTCSSAKASQNHRQQQQRQYPPSSQHYHHHTGSISTGGRNGRCTSGQTAKRKLQAIQQERRLAWLTCYFLDGLMGGPLGLEFCATGANLEIRKLIRDASYTTDTTQDATLIFWYLHLDLVHIYRRICEMYRTSSPAWTSQSDRVPMTKVRQGVEMLSIEHALGLWLENVPAHLIYTPQNKNQLPVENQTAAGDSDSSLPSFYSLYLYRFFYSVKLLLYRPWISSADYRGDLSDSNSAISQCANAAAMLTEIGDIVFQNYSWPWHGCGLFAYHMLQATEIHLYFMLTQHTRTTILETQNMYYRTVGMIKGYADFANLVSLRRSTQAMEQMVQNYLSTSERRPNPPTAFVRASQANAILHHHHHQLQSQPQLQQYLQLQHQHSGAKSAIPLEYSHTNVIPVSMSSSTSDMNLLTQQHLHISPQYQHQQLLQPAFTGEAQDATMFSPLQSTVDYTTHSAVVSTNAGADLFRNGGVGAGGGLFPIELEDPLFSTDIRRSQQQQPQQEHSPLSTFLYDMATPVMSLYTQSAPDLFASVSDYRHHDLQSTNNNNTNSNNSNNSNNNNNTNNNNNNYSNNNNNNNNTNSSNTNSSNTNSSSIGGSNVNVNHNAYSSYLPTSDMSTLTPMVDLMGLNNLTPPQLQPSPTVSQPRSRSPLSSMSLSLPNTGPLTTPCVTIIPGQLQPQRQPSTSTPIPPRRLTPSKPATPPAKPPKRIHPQSTGSTNSSGKSASQKPPVPKKPSRLMELGGAAALSTFAQLSQLQNRQLSTISPHQPSPPYSSSPTPSSPSPHSPGDPPRPRRLVKVLQAQSRLYDPKNLYESYDPVEKDFGRDKEKDQEKDEEDVPHEEQEEDYGLDSDEDLEPEWKYMQECEYGLEFMRMEPEVENQYPPQNRPQVL